MVSSFLPQFPSYHCSSVEQRTVSEVFVIIKKTARSISTKCFFYSVSLLTFLIFCLAVCESDDSLVVLSMLFLFFSFCFLQKNVDV